MKEEQLISIDEIVDIRKRIAILFLEFKKDRTEGYNEALQDSLNVIDSHLERLTGTR